MQPDESLKHLCRICVLICLLLQFQQLWAQPEGFRNLGAANGFPASDVACLYRARTGLVWIGGAESLIRFNGWSYTVFDRWTGAPGTQLFVAAIIEDRQGGLWMSGRNSLLYLAPGAEVIRSYGHSSLREMDGRCISFNHDSSRIWLATQDGPLLIDPADTAQPIRELVKTPGVAALFPQPDNSLLIYTMEHSIVHLKSGRITTLLKDTSLCGLVRDRHTGNLVAVCTNGFRMGAFREGHLQLDTLLHIPGFRASNQPMQWNELVTGYMANPGHHLEYMGKQPGSTLHTIPCEPGNPFSLGSELTRHAYEDAGNTIWISRMGGISYHIPAFSALEFISAESMGVKIIWALHQDANGTLLAGTDAGLMLSRDGKKWEGPFNPSAGKRFLVTSMMDAGDAWLINALSSRAWLLDKRTLRFRIFNLDFPGYERSRIYGISPLPGQQLLVWGDNLLFTATAQGRIGRKLALPPGERKLFSALVDRQGRTWAGMFDGLLLYDKNGKLKRQFSSGAAGGSLPANTILHVFESADGRIWMGTMGGGLCVFNESRQQFEPVALPGNPVHIYMIQEANGNGLVISTNKGLVWYREGKSIVLNKQNLLPFNDFNQYSACTAGSNLYFGGETGIVKINAGRLKLLEQPVQRLQFIFNGIPAEDVRLEPGISLLEGEVMLQDALPCKQVLLSYRLAGWDENWLNLEPGQPLRISGLQPGVYTLEIKAVDPNNWLSIAPFSVKVNVLPQWWQTWWFRALCILAGLLLLVALVRYLSQFRLKLRLKQLEAEKRIAEERSRISRELHDNVGSELSYLISGIEVAGMIAQEEDRSRLESQLQRLHSSAKGSIAHLRDAIWALNQEGRTVQDLEIHFRVWSSRFLEACPSLEAHLRFDIRCNYMLEPLYALHLFRMMQEAIHNTVKHAGAGKLELELRSDEAGISLLYQDDGKGFLFEQKADSYGLQTLRFRADEMEAVFNITSEPGAGMRLSLQLDPSQLKHA